MKKRILSMMLCISMVLMLFADFIQPIHFDLDIFAWAAGDDVAGGDNTQASPSDGEDGSDEDENVDDTPTFTKPKDCHCDNYTEENHAHDETCPRYNCSCTEEEYKPEGASDEAKHTSKTCQKNPNNVTCLHCNVTGGHTYKCQEACDQDCSSVGADGQNVHNSDCVIEVEGTGCTAGCVVTSGKSDSGEYKYPAGKTGEQYMHLYYCEKNCDCGETNGKHKYNCITNCKCYLSKNSIPTADTHAYYCPLHKCEWYEDAPEEEEKATCCYADEANNTFVHHNINCYQYTPECCDGIDDDGKCEKKQNIGSDIVTYSFTHASDCQYHIGVTSCGVCGLLGSDRHAPSCTNNPIKDTNIDTLLTGANCTITTSSDNVKTYTLNKDVTLAQSLYIAGASKYSYVIDLAGHILSGNNKDAVIINHGNLTITDSIPTTQHKGRLVDRGYYYYYDTVAHYKDVRVMEDALWVPVADNYSGDDVVTIYGGLITGGKLSHASIDYGVAEGSVSLGAPFGVETFTDEQIANALGKTEADVAKMAEYEKLAEVMSSTTASSYFKKVILQHKRTSHMAYGGAGIANIGVTASLTINGGTIAGCETVATYTGSAVFSNGGAQFTMNGGVIKYNFASGGGAVYLQDQNTKFDFNNGIIYENTNIGYGGVVARWSSVIEIGDVSQTNDANKNGTPDWDESDFDEKLKAATTWNIPVIHSNRAASITINEGNGGGIYADEGVNIDIHGALIMNNWSHYRGGGIDLYLKGHLLMDGDVDIISNYCETKGGGVSVHYGNDYEIVDGSPSLSCSIVGNRVNIEENMAAYGAGMYMSHLGLNIKGGTVNNNKAIGYYVSQTNAFIGNPLLYTVIGYDGELAAIKKDEDDNILKYYKPDPNGQNEFWNYSEQQENYTLVDGVKISSGTGGGGIYFDGKVDVKISGGEICGNTANGSGGGLIMMAGDLDISQENPDIPTKINHNRIVYSTTDNIVNDVDVYDNIDRVPTEKDGDGAGLRLGAGNITMSGGEISGNIAKNTEGNGGEGGGISLSNGSFKMTAGKITYNISRNTNGGGLHVPSGNDTVIDISGGEISNNKSGDNGGGLALYCAGEVKISGDARISSNWCHSRGGAIMSTYVKFTMTGGEISENEAKAAVGGVWLRDGGSFTMSGGKITKNSTNGDTGGISLGSTDKSAEFVMTGGEISENVAGTNGGGVVINHSSKVQISGTSLIVNNQAGIKGGGMYLTHADTSLTISGNVSISNNKTLKEHGGAIAMNAGGTVLIEGGQLKDNVAGFSGGAIFINSGPTSFTMIGGEISGNVAEAGNGGAVYVYGDENKCEFTLKNGVIKDNHAKQNAGGIVLSADAPNSGAVFTMEGGEITGNTAGIAYTKYAQDGTTVVATVQQNNGHSRGGGVYLQDTYNSNSSFVKFVMTGGTISENKVDGNGGGVFVRNGNFIMNSGTISSNEAVNNNNLSSDNNLTNVDKLYGSGGAIAVFGGNCTIKKGAITENKAYYWGSAIFLSKPTDNANEVTLDLGVETNKAQNTATEFDVVITDNKITGTVQGVNGTAGYGGGAIRSNNATVNMYNADVSRNENPQDHDYYAGGAFHISSGDFYVHGGRISNNRSPKHWGGAVYMYGGNLTMYRGVAHDNYTGDNGGFAYVCNTGNVYLHDGVDIYNNTAASYCGGAFCLSEGNVYMYGGKVRNNKLNSTTKPTDSYERGYGGAFALHSDHAKFHMYGGEITGNQTGTNALGGAIAFTVGGTCNIYGGTISGNSAASGGGIFIRKGTLNIGKANCTGESDDAHNLLDPTQSNCGHPIIKNNTARDNGGGIMVASGITNIYCGNIVNNTAGANGGGIYISDDMTTNRDDNAVVNVFNATVTGNIAANVTSGHNLYMDKDEKESTLTYTNSDTFGTSDNPGVIIINGKYIYDVEPPVQLVAIYMRDRDTDEVKREIQLPEGANINLPDGVTLFDKGTGYTFLGWQHPYRGECVDAPDDYKPAGTAITVVADEINGVKQEKMTLYAVFAPEKNNIVVYQSQQSLANGAGGTNKGTYTYGVDFNTPAAITKDGYTFTGWTVFQNRNKDGNWGLDINGVSVEASTKFVATVNSIKRFGELQFAANWTTTLNYIMVVDGEANGTCGMLSQSTQSITVGAETTKADGSMPTAGADYIFVGWYTNKACTTAVDASFVDQTNGKLTPVAGEDGFYDVLTYYAKFEPRYTDLTITTSGTDANQSFVFVVKSSSLTHTGNNVKYNQLESAAVDMEVIFVANGDGNGTVTIKHVPVGKYTVYEKNCDKTKENTWTWRYSNTDSQTNSDMNFPFVFNNDASKIVIWLSHFEKYFFKVSK